MTDPKVSREIGDELVNAVITAAVWSEGQKPGIWQKMIEALNRGGAKTEEDIARCKTGIDDILRRKDKLLDLSIDGRISDEEFSLRNDRFNGEIEQLRHRLQELEAEKIKNQDMMQSIEMLRQAITKELDFTNGFSVGVIDALLDHIEVNGTGEKNRVHVKVFLKAVPKKVNFLIKRARNKTSVCIRQYT